MTTQDVATKFHEYMQQGAFDKIYTELFSEDATSDETPGSDWTKANGMKEIHEKGKKWQEVAEEMYGGTTAVPVVAGDYFTCFMTMDFKPRGGERTNMQEIGLYKVKNGKIVSEQFFY
ncbi:MAG: nuclear transport factor 2 family protein [Bacteroidota bacterium]